MASTLASTAKLLFLTTDIQDSSGLSTADQANGSLILDTVSGGTEVSSAVITNGATTHLFAPAYEAPGTTNNVIVTYNGSLAVDAARQTYFLATEHGSIASRALNYYGDAVIYAGSTVTGAPTSTTPIYNALTAAQASSGQYYSIINDIVTDPANNRVYFSQTVATADANGFYSQSVAAQTGIYVMSEAGAAPTRIVSGVVSPDVIALDLADNLIFFTNSTGVDGLSIQGVAEEQLDVYNISTGVTTTLLSEGYRTDAQIGTQSNGGNIFDGLAVDPASRTLYFTANNLFNNLTTDAYANPATATTGVPDTQDGIYKARFSVSGNTVSLGGPTTLYSGANAFDPSRISIDVQNGVFYVNGNTVVYITPDASNEPTATHVYEGSLTATNTTALTQVTPTAETTGSTTDENSATGPHVGEAFGMIDIGIDGNANVLLDDIPLVNASGSVTYASGNGAVATDAGLTTRSGTAVDYASATVALTGGEAGDVLAAAVAGTAIAASYSSSTFTLTLTGVDTLAHYQQVLDSVSYNNTTTDPTQAGASISRTVTDTVNDGLSTGSGTSTIAIEAAPVLAAGSPTPTYTGGAAAMAVDTVLTLTDYTAPNLTGATVKLSAGYLAGDTLNVTTQNGITGSYATVSTSGTLTLSGTATVANYQAAIRSITYSFAGNGDPTAGNDTSRGLSYAVTDSNGLTSNTGTSTLAVVHGAPSVTAGAAVSFTRGSFMPVTVDPTAAVTAPDSAGNLVSATVTVTNVMPGDVLAAAVSVTGVTASYNSGLLTLAGTATAAQYQALLDSVTFTTGNAAATGTRTLSYIVNDGPSRSTAVTSTVAVVAPTPTITGAVAGQAVNDAGAIQPFATLTVGDAAGESITATTITLSAAGVASDADGALSGAGLTKIGTGTYTLATATPAALGSELAALTFTPTRHQVAAGATVTTGFTVAVTDTGGSTASNAATTVVAKAAADTPAITGAHGPTTTTDLVPVQPFSGVGIAEPDYNAMPTVTIEVRNQGVDTDANGALSGTGLTKTGTGIYVLAAATPAALTNEIDALTFTPAHDQVAIGQTVTTTFAVTAAFAGLTATDGVTSVQATDVPCFCAGTMMATPDGEVAVEMLAAGDVVLTASGERRPVKWVGHRTVSPAHYTDRLKVWPVRIARDAFGPAMPARDLYVSPDHSIAVRLVEDVLIPANKLVNGATIAYAPCDIVTYWHVELDSHDLLLAENLRAESYLEMGENRGFFTGDAPAASPPDEIPAHSLADFCRPYVSTGPFLDVARAQLASRAQRMGWQPECHVTLTATAGGVSVPVTVVGGEATMALACGTSGLSLDIGTFVPAHLGEADARRMGLSIHSLIVVDADGAERALHLDDPALLPAFHAGEREAGMHHRWTQGELTLPPAMLSALPGPLTVRIHFDPNTVRRWREPAVTAPATRLRAA